MDKIGSLSYGKSKAMPAITTSQMRMVDRLMIERYGISLVQMMENAGRNLADLVQHVLRAEGRNITESHLVVLCGTGNNGGGGMVAARYLSNRGAKVQVLLVGNESRLKPVSKRQWQTLTHLPVSIIPNKSDNLKETIHEADLIIDAMVGYGLRGPLRGIPMRITELVLESGNTQVIALDVPSGMNTDTGRVENIGISAMATLTLALPKTGLVHSSAKSRTGDLYVADIGVPPGLYADLGSDYWFNEAIIQKVALTP